MNEIFVLSILWKQKQFLAMATLMMTAKKCDIPLHIRVTMCSYIFFLEQ